MSQTSTSTSPIEIGDAADIAAAAIPAVAEQTPETAARARWKTRRDYMERHREKRLPDGKRHRRRFGIFSFFIGIFGRFLKLSGQYHRGVLNAIDIRVNRVEVVFSDLPEAFDGYTLLQLTDLHLDSYAPATRRMIEVVDGLEVDAVVMTGDYRFRISGPYEQIVPDLESMLGGLNARDGMFCVLGNHDTIGMVGPFERLGVRVLANETVTIKRGEASLHLVGIDDVHYYYTAEATIALRAAPAGFKVALIHSPELVREAADAGISLYLAGHTHGGQICLPGGRPVICHMNAPRCYASGLWRLGGMMGYTSSGAGTSGLPVRFNSQSEVALITLRRAN